MVNLREKEIQDILKRFRERTGIISSTLFTEDGFIVAIEQAHFGEDDDFFQSIAAICSGIVCLADNGIVLLKEDNFIKKITIQAGTNVDNDTFIIILESVTNDIRLAISFPAFLNIGVILFELNHTIQKLSNYFAGFNQGENLKSSVNTLL